MKEVGFPGMEKIQVFQDDSELVSLLSFFLKISEGTRIKRTGWVQNGIRDPERIAGTYEYIFEIIRQIIIIQLTDFAFSAFGLNII